MADTLRPKQKDFISAYTDKDAPTYGNATQSAITAGYGTTYKSSAAQGSAMLDNPRIQSEIERILEENNASYKVRVKQMLDIATNRTTLEAETENLDADGNVVSRSKTKRSVPTADRLKALKLLSDLTGETQLAHTRGEVLSSRLRDVSRRMMKRVGESSTITPLDDVESRGEPSDGAEQGSGRGQGLEGGTGGGDVSIHSPLKIDDIKKAEGGDLGIIVDTGEWDE